MRLSDRCRETGLGEAPDAATEVVSHNLPHVVDAPRLRVGRARNVEGSKPAAAQHKSMTPVRGIKIPTDDIASVVDAGEPGKEEGVGEINRREIREIARIHEEPVLDAIDAEEADDVTGFRANPEGGRAHRTRGIEGRVSPPPQ